MKTLVTLGNQPNWHFRNLETAAQGTCHLRFVTWNELSTSLGGSENSRRETIHLPSSQETGDADAVLVRGMPNGSLEQVVFCMDVLARWQATGMRVVNSAKSLEAAIDKYLSLALIHAADLPIPHTFVCQSVESAMSAFEKLNGDVVLKPVFGGEGRGIMRLQDPELALRAFRTVAHLDGTLYLQEFIDHQNRDVRCLVIGKEVIGMQRHNPDDWRTNATRGATCTALELTDTQIDLSQRAAAAVGAEIAGVDLIESVGGETFVLEVNGIPGWQHIAEASNQDIATKILRTVLGEST